MKKFIIALLCSLVSITKASPAPYKYTLSIGAIFKNEARFFDEWIRYHRMVGVEHFYLYNDKSTDNWEEVLKPYIDEGLVEVTYWPIPQRNSLIDYQCRAYRDVLKKTVGVTEWIALTDLDEFIVPAQEGTITQCLDNHFKNASAVYINWHNFGTNYITLKPGQLVLSSLTACSELLHPRNAVGKSIIKPHHINIDRLWHPHHAPIKEGSIYCDGDGGIIPYSDKDSDLVLDGKRHDAFMHINHYCMRGEDIYELKKSEVNEQFLFEEHHVSFNKYKSHDILNFIQKHHPREYNNLWGAVAQKPFVMAAGHCGQLGNQLFQVATACALAWDNNAEPYFPDWHYDYPVNTHVFSRLNKKQPPYEIAFEWGDGSASYNPIPYHNNMKISGYFQCEKYFQHHRKQLLALFAPREDDLVYMKNKYAWLFNDPNTVGIQLRYYKWEFAQDDQTYPQYGIDYLEKAMALFPPTSTFVVSSNNIEFARKNIPAWATNVIFLEDESNYIDLYLLSFCKHNIITNSSFGWWAAWLNQNPKKLVVRPAYWNGYAGYSQDVSPESWIKVYSKYE